MATMSQGDIMGPPMYMWSVMDRAIILQYVTEHRKLRRVPDPVRVGCYMGITLVSGLRKKMRGVSQGLRQPHSNQN
jgi:hypothetical protein